MESLSRLKGIANQGRVIEVFLKGPSKWALRIAPESFPVFMGFDKK